MKHIIIAVTICIYSSVVVGQSDSSAYKAGWGSLDFSIPESPASKILGSGADNIIKPTSVRKVAVDVGNYFLSSGGIIPKNLAVEIAPLLLNGNASLNDYNKYKFWYRLRLSVGTNVLNNGAYNIAEGLRMTIIDKTDLRDASSNPGFMSYIYATAVENAVAHDRVFAAYAAAHGAKTVEVSDKYFNDKGFKHLIDSVYANEFVNINAVASYRDSVRNLLWNRPIWEIGLATLQSSVDSLTKNLKLSQLGFWSTAGFPLGKKGQLLIGVKGGLLDSIKWNTTLSVGERAYYGNNTIKGFIQAQYDYKNQLSSFTGSFGCQFNISSGLWGEFGVNLVLDGHGTWSYQPSFSIGLGTPEKKKP